MENTYRECEIQFLEQKRFPSKEAGRYNSSTKNVVQINLKSFLTHIPFLQKSLRGL